jgi:FkbM family methyltransferase
MEQGDRVNVRQLPVVVTAADALARMAAASFCKVNLTFRASTAMTKTLAELLSPQRLTEVVDVGANPIDGKPPYTPMLAAGLCRVTGFEPQEQALRELRQRMGPNENYLPLAVGDGGAHTLHVCVGPGMTSLFEPDPGTLGLFDFLRPLAEITRRVPVQTRRLDDIAEIERVDFLKIDIQGGELAVFKGGAVKLSQAVVVQTEISYVTLYQGQPTLGDIDLELRRQGFIPHCFAAVKQLPIAPWIVGGNPRRPFTQLLEADMVYVRDFAHPELMSDEQLKHLALIVHHCYGSHDLALRCVMLLEQRQALEAGAQHSYLQFLAAS